MVIEGVGPEAEIIEKSNGYKTSDVPYAMHLMPGAALLRMSNIMHEGAKTHGENNWKNGSVEEHLNKLLIHAFAYLAGDTSDDHLGHLAWRGMAALEIKLQKKPFCCVDCSVEEPEPVHFEVAAGSNGRCVA